MSDIAFLQAGYLFSHAHDPSLAIKLSPESTRRYKVRGCPAVPDTARGTRGVINPIHTSFIGSGIDKGRVARFPAAASGRRGCLAGDADS